MFLIDKYRPISKDKIDFHKSIYDLLDIMSKDEAIPNMIFYGPEGSGKNTMINIFLEMLFDETIHKTKNTAYEVAGSGSKKNIEMIKQSNYHIVINPQNNNYDRYLIHHVVKEYAKRRSLNAFKTNRSFKIVVINNLDNMLYYAQTSLRRTMERYNDKCRFIMQCTSLSKVIEPLHSRCVCICVPSPTDNELVRYLFKISAYERLPLSLEKYHDIIEQAGGNIKKALWALEYAKYKYDINTDYYDSINLIIKLIIELKLENTLQIRNIIFNLMITNLDGTTIMRTLIDKLICSDKISEKSKQKIIKETSDFEYQLIKGRREIIHFDALITSIMKILYDERQIKKLKN